MSRSPGIEGPGVTVPSIRWPELPLRAIPVVDPPAAPVDPVEFAVPKVLVPGAVGIFTELPAPLGSLAELFSPPTFAGPLGTPLTAAVPAPGAPAFGEPTALPLPTLGPLAAPAAEVPPAEPPPVCASAKVPVSDNAAVNAIIVVFMWLPFAQSGDNHRTYSLVPKHCCEPGLGNYRIVPRTVAWARSQCGAARAEERERVRNSGIVGQVLSGMPGG